MEGAFSLMRAYGTIVTEILLPEQLRFSWSAEASPSINLRTVRDLDGGLRYHAVEREEHVMIATEIDSRENFRASGLPVSLSPCTSSSGV